MEKFSKEQFGYSVNEVEHYITKMRNENDEKIKRLNQKIIELKQENLELKKALDKHKSVGEKITTELAFAEEKAQKIIDSAKTVYELEIKRMQLLYRKWDDVLKKLTTNLSTVVPENEIMAVTGDFNKALSMTLETSFTMQNEEGKLYAKSVLTRMGGGKKHKSTTEFIRKSGSNKNVFSSETITIMQESSAEKFLNGEGVEIPASMGKLGKDIFNIPPSNAYNEKKEKGFSLEEALVPKESLEEIMKSFAIED